MDLEEARKIIKISPEEIGSIERYLGFQHTSINILSDLTPENYDRLRKSAWVLPETEEDIEKFITDFVNIYAAMYKESKGRKTPNNLIRGTSRKVVPAGKKIINQMISTSTDEGIAKRFCKYGDAALIRFYPEKDVPFLDAENYRGENGAVEEEIILAPFCQVTKTNYVGEFNGYAYYNISVGRPELTEQTEGELQAAMSDVINGFSQNVEEMKKCIELSDTYELLMERMKRARRDREETEYLGEKKRKTSEEHYEKSISTQKFREKLQNLLKGLCRKKELEIDKAQSVIDAENKRKAKEKKEKNRLELIAELSRKVTESPRELAQLQDTLVSTYQELIQSELEAKRIAKVLQIPFSNMVSTTNIGNKVKQIQENIKHLQQKVNQTQVSKEESMESVQTILKDIGPIIDSISYGLEISQDIPSIVSMYQAQSSQELKRNLYMKVQNTIQDAKVQKYLRDRDAISAEGMSFFGGITGKNDLQIERLNNVNLKIQLAQSTVPEEMQNYSVRDMLADLYACATVELGGEFTPEMQKLYKAIKRVYGGKNIGEFSDEYIAQIAREKIVSRADNLLMVPTGKSFFGKNKTQTELLRLENQSLKCQIEQEKSKKKTTMNPVSGQNAVSLLDSKLDLIKSATADRSKLRDRENLDKTFDLFG